jgi:multiple sugar transport system permease protein
MAPEVKSGGVRTGVAEFLTVGSSSRAAERRSTVRRRQVRLGLLFVSPWLLGFLVFNLYPFVATWYYSFTNDNGVGAAKFVGFANYTHLVHDSLFVSALFNTFYYSAIEVPLSMVIALGLAMLLNMNVRGKALYRTVYYLPSVVPLVSGCMLWLWIFNPSYGIVNSLLSLAHVPGPAWMFSETWSKPSFILLGLWGLGQPMVIYLAALQGVPHEMYEVSAVEGAGPLQRLRYVTLPMISPIILFNTVMALVTCTQYFTQAYVMTNGGPDNSTLFYSLYLYQQAFEDLHFGYASAMAWLLFVIIAVITGLFFRWSSRWVYYGNSG